MLFFFQKNYYEQIPKEKIILHNILSSSLTIILMWLNII